MAPKSLIKTLKYKPQERLVVVEDDVANPENLDDVVYGRDPPGAPRLPPPTPHELAAWARARALQTSLPNGQPAEGWPARINQMIRDGRLYSLAGRWYRRGT